MGLDPSTLGHASHVPDVEGLELLSVVAMVLRKLQNFEILVKLWGVLDLQ